MKHLVLFCLFLIGVASFSPAQGVVQGEDAGSESPVYQSFFGQNSTLWYLYGIDASDFPPLRLVQRGGKRNSEYLVGYDYYEVDDDLVLAGLKDITISPDNSQIWWKDYEGKNYLICDLNLGIGDSLPFFSDTRKYAVNKVFWEEGLKHIQFELKLITRYDTVPYEIVEGVGSLYPLLCTIYYPRGICSENPPLMSWNSDEGDMIRSVYKDGKLFYRHPLWTENWDLMIYQTIGVEKHSSDLLSVSGEDHEILIEDPGCSHSGEEVVISDKDGRV